MRKEANGNVRRVRFKIKHFHENTSNTVIDTWMQKVWLEINKSYRQ